MTIEAGQQLSHYRLIEKIGQGGMGVVWKAEDTVLGRTVAIKVLPADVSRDEKRRRMFLQEAQLASQVSAAHIVQVHEFGREGDLGFIVMEYVEGNPLGKLLHGRPLPPHKVADFGYQIAHALSRAHRKNLLHRDLKPANVIVTPDGEVKVLDFGLATLFERSGTVTLSQVTTEIGDPGPEPIGLAGTLPYMSPEQARMEQLDGRSDVFSLGSILYEMTTGQLPFIGSTSAEVLQSIQQGRSKPVHDLVPQVPLELDRIIQKAMAPQRRDRYQSIEDLAVDLNRLRRELESGSSPSYEDLARAALPERGPRRLHVGIAGASVLAAVALGVWWFGFRSGDGLDERTILVPPLEVKGQVDGADYVGRAFAEALAISLAEAKGIRVLPVPSASAVRADGTSDHSKTARQFAARYFITGRLTRSGESVEVSVNLIDAAENRLVWGCHRDSSDGQLYVLASFLARETASQLGVSFPHLYDYPWNLADSPTLADSHVTAQVISALSRDDFESAATASEQLLGEFPEEPGALTLRALALHRDWYTTQTPGDAALLNEALAQLRYAVPDSPHADAIRAERLFAAGHVTEASSLLEAVVQRGDLAPKLRARCIQLQAAIKRHQGYIDDAIRELESAIGLDPSSPESYRQLSLSLRTAGRIDEAVERAKQSVALAPSYWGALQTLSLALTDAGLHEEAVEAARQACEGGLDQLSCATFAGTLQRVGLIKNALAAARQAEDLTDSLWGTYNLACFWAGQGDGGRAKDWLRRSVDLGLTSAYVAADPDLESLHGDPEFDAIIAGIKKRLGEE